MSIRALSNNVYMTRLDKGGILILPFNEAGWAKDTQFHLFTHPTLPMIQGSSCPDMRYFFNEAQSHGTLEEYLSELETLYTGADIHFNDTLTRAIGLNSPKDTINIQFNSLNSFEIFLAEHRLHITQGLLQDLDTNAPPKEVLNLII